MIHLSLSQVNKYNYGKNFVFKAIGTGLSLINPLELDSVYSDTMTGTRNFSFNHTKISLR